MILASGKTMQENTSIVLASLVGAIAIVGFGALTSYASTLSIEEPPMQGHALNLSRDEMDRDLTIDPDANFTGTQELPTEGATDIDLNQIPPVGVSIIITNETVVVTKEPVTVG
jgi:hypothetical protein